jgi:hypothetical protein
VRHAAPAPIPPPPVKSSYPTAPMPRPRYTATTEKTEESELKSFVRKNGKILFISLFFVALVIFGIAYLFSDDAEPSYRTAATTGNNFTASHKYTAEEYWIQFFRDNSAASLKFDEISVQLTGKVRKVISEGNKNALLFETSSNTLTVECQFQSKDAIESVKEGDQVTIVGEGKARKKPKAENVELINCRLKPNGE